MSRAWIGILAGVLLLVWVVAGERLREVARIGELSLAPTLERDWPDLAPFRASRNWDALRTLSGLRAGEAPDPGVLEEGERRVRGAFEASARAKAAQDAASPRPASVRLDAALGADPGLERRAWLALLPLAMDLLEPLWRASGAAPAPAWREGELALARAAAAFLARDPSAPRVAFESAEPAENRARLARLATWFEEHARDPEVWSRMIFTFDEGPWRFLETDRAMSASPRVRVSIDASLELRLDATSEADPAWIAELARAGQAAWTRALSEVPADAGLHPREDYPPVRLGTYGWKVALFLGSRRDAAAVWAYLGPEGEPLFYFTMRS